MYELAKLIKNSLKTFTLKTQIQRMFFFVKKIYGHIFLYNNMGFIF